MTIDDLLPKLLQLKQFSPLAGRTELYLETPEGLCQLVDFSHDIDHDVDPPEPYGAFEAESAAFSGGIDPDIAANYLRGA